MINVSKTLKIVYISSSRSSATRLSLILGMTFACYGTLWVRSLGPRHVVDLRDHAANQRVDIKTTDSQSFRSWRESHNTFIDFPLGDGMLCAYIISYVTCTNLDLRGMEKGLHDPNPRISAPGIVEVPPQCYFLSTQCFKTILAPIGPTLLC